MIYVRKGDSGFTTTTVSEAHGESVTEELYTEEGLTTHTLNKKTGSKIKEFWPRQVKEDGWFKVVKHENTKAWYKAVGEEKFNRGTTIRVFN